MAVPLSSPARAHRENQAVENPQHGQRRQRIDVAFLENDVDVHQPVAQNRVGPGERNQRQRQHRQVHGVIGRHAHHVRDRVDQRERQNAEQRAVAQPGQLAAHDGVVGAAQLERQHAAARPGTSRTGTPATRDPAASALRAAARSCAAIPEYTPRWIASQSQPGQVQQRPPRRAAGSISAAPGKTQQKCRNSVGARNPGHHVAVVNDLVEIVQFAGIVEGRTE